MKKLTLILLVSMLLIPLASSVSTLIVDEMDLVKLNVQATDADGDPLIYTFGTPLNASGEWQTTYDDAGEYIIDVIVDDGTMQTLQQVILVVNNINRVPSIEIENEIEVDEGDTVEVLPTITDPDNDALTMTISDPVGDDGVWETNNADAGTYTVTVSVTDGEAYAGADVTIIVNDVNVGPEVNINPGENIDLLETESVELGIEATDFDGDELFYGWYLDEERVSETQYYTFVTDFESQGTYELVAVVEDKETKIEKTVTINVANVNREPEVDVSEEISVLEGDPVILDLPETDIDGDEISYSFSRFFDETGIWQTDFEDAGEYDITITIDDGHNQLEKSIHVIVLDVDRAPEADDMVRHITEGEKVSIRLEAVDPDGDTINYTLIEGPANITINNDLLEWTPGYDAVKIERGWLTEKLFSLNLVVPGHNQTEIYNAKVLAQGKEKNTEIKITFVVMNKNRAPVIDATDVKINETDELDLDITAYDPDGDPLQITYLGAIDKPNYASDYEDEGKYLVKIVAFDGELEAVKEVTVTIYDNNREPELKTRVAKFKEGRFESFEIVAQDPDNDNVTITPNDLPEGASFENNQIKFEPNHFFVSHNVSLSLRETILSFFTGRYADIDASFTISDGETAVERNVTIRVKDVNQPPIIQEIPEVTVYEGQSLHIPVVATDPDGDPITFKFKGLIKENDQVLGYEDEGKHNVTVIASDGKDKSSALAPINVLHTNRAPEMKALEDKTKENEQLTLALKGSDPDGDDYFYSILEGPEGATIVQSDLIWTPSYDTVMHKFDVPLGNGSVEVESQRSTLFNALSFEVPIIVQISDGELSSNETIIIEVFDVNRAPVILNATPVQEFTTTAGTVVTFSVDAIDPDGDEITYTWKPSALESYSGDVGSHMRKMTEPGIKTMTLVVSDGQDESEIGWKYAVNVPEVVAQPSPEPEVIVEQVIITAPVLTETQTFVIEG